MKKLAFLAVAAMAVSAYAQGSVFTRYHHWTMRPETVKDAAAGDLVRHQDDQTSPMHGPWLLNPAQDFITINWVTRRPCAGGIQYREKGTEEFRTVWEIKYGAIDFSKDLHTIHLKNLKPGTEYEYRLLSASDRNQTPYYSMHHVGREINSFKTLDPQKDNYKVFLTADFHGTARLCLDPIYEKSNAEEADFFFFLGDNVEDSMGNARYYTTFGFLDDVGRLWGKTKPTVYLRGNHDFSGREMYQFGDYFPHPDGRTYQAFRQGPALFICLDSLWLQKGVQGDQVTAYIQEQADWIKALKKTDDWKNSKFRIVMLHVPFIGYGGAVYLQPFMDALNDNTPGGRVHAVLAGHEHAYQRVDRNSWLSKEPKLKKNEKLTRKNRYEFKPVPYTQVTCDLMEAMTIDVSPEKLVFKSYNWRTNEGKLVDHFEILPDGSVKDLQPVFHRDLTPPAAAK